MKKILKRVLDLPKTIFLNVYYFPFSKAITFPIYCSYDVKLGSLGKRGSIEIPKGSRLILGNSGSFALANRKTYFHIGTNGRLVLKGNAVFSKGTQLVVDGILTIGRDFWCNANCLINCGKNITVGDEVLLGWDITVLDGDGHQVNNKESYKDVKIGDHVWLGFNSKLLKGSELGDGTIVAANSLVSKPIKEKNVLIVETNKIAKAHIEWSK